MEKIKITVGMCSVECEGGQLWSKEAIMEVTAALSKASIENGEESAKAEIEIVPSGSLYPLAWKCNHGKFLCTNDPPCRVRWLHHREDCEKHKVPDTCWSPGHPLIES